MRIRSPSGGIGIQRQLSKNMMLSVAYVGSKNTRLDYTGWANAARQASPQGTSLGAIDSLKLLPFMVPNWHYTQSTGIANYNGLEVKFERHFSSGLLTLLSYTWSRSLDNSSGFFAAENGSGGGSVVQNYFTPNQNYGVSGYNVPQLLTWSTVYDLPVGRGKRFLNSGPLSWVLGNWGMNYVFIARSGQPYNLVVNGDIANISGNGGSLSGYARPNLVGNRAALVRPRPLELKTVSSTPLPSRFPPSRSETSARMFCATSRFTTWTFPSLRTSHWAKADRSSFALKRSTSSIFRFWARPAPRLAWPRPV
jgi:hypothetical protein